MKTYISKTLVSILLLFVAGRVSASHIVGGEVTYSYLGDSTGGGNLYHKYQVSLSIYEDCLNGDPSAIAQDNPAFLGAFDAVTQIPYEIDTNVNYSFSVSVPDLYTSPCGKILVPNTLCLLKKTFIKAYALPANANGYVISYQRCCRNASIVNVLNPGNDGCTYYCTIPGNINNNSAVFRNYPPQTICLNQPLVYDNSAIDVDGDSLSYGFCAALNGANNNNIKPIPAFPSFGDTVVYVSPTYSSQMPISGSPAIAINPATGLITGTPNLIGRYLVTVYCNEWRAGALINTIKREFQFVVTDCNNGSPVFAPYVGADTIILVGDTVQFNAAGGISYTWAPPTYLSDTSIGNPVGLFPVPGVFTYTLTETSDSGCSGKTTKRVTVLEHSEFIVPTGFTPNGDGKNDLLAPLPVLGCTLISFKVFNRKGNKVYDGGPNDLGWDGYYKGAKQDLGTYYWELLYYDNNGNERKEKGDATLVR